MPNIMCLLIVSSIWIYKLSKFLKEEECFLFKPSKARNVASCEIMESFLEQGYHI